MHLPYILNAAPHQGSYVDLSTYLLEHRTLFLGPELTSTLASSFVMQMLALLQKEGEISIYLNCYGGSVPAGLAIADVIDYATAKKVPVHTYCLGECVGIATVILAAGTKGKRRAFPSARISLYQEWYGAESLWGAASQDDQERSRLMQLIEKRFLENTRVGAVTLTKEVELAEKDWQALVDRFPEETMLPRLVATREQKYYLNLDQVFELRDRREIAPEAAIEAQRLAGAAHLRNYLQKLEFLNPEESLRCGIIDGLVETAPTLPGER